MNLSDSTKECESYNSKQQREYQTKDLLQIVATFIRLYWKHNFKVHITKLLYFCSQVDQLGEDLTSQWEQSSKLHLDLERMKRLESDMKREVASKSNQIEELKVEIKLRNTAHLSDLTQINSEKHSLEQEVTSLRYFFLRFVKYFQSSIYQI